MQVGLSWGKSKAATNAANMVSYMADNKIKDPVEEGMKRVAMSFISGVTGLPIDTDAASLAGKTFNLGVEFTRKAAGATGVAGLPYKTVTATVDGVVKGYQVTQDNRTFATIGKASQLSTYATRASQTSGGVLCCPDNGVAVLAGSPPQQYADDLSEHEAYVKDGGSKAYNDWFDEMKQKQEQEGDQQ